MLLNAETVTLLLGVAVLAGIYVWSKQKDVKNGKPIPGPRLVDKRSGHNSDIQAAGNMSQFLLKMHKIYGHVFGFYMGSTYTVSLGSPSTLGQTSKLFDRPAFASTIFRPLFGPRSVTVSNGQDARKRVTAYAKFLSYSNLDVYFPFMQRKADEVCEAFLSKEKPIEVYDDLLKYSFWCIEAAVFGGDVPVDDKMMDRIGVYQDAWAECEKNLTGDIMEPGSEREKHFNNCMSVINTTVSESYEQSMKTDSTEGTSYSRVVNDLGLDEQTAFNDIITFVVGGFHNASHMLEWGMYFLAKDSSIQAKMNKEIKEVLGDEPVTMESLKHLIYVHQFIDELQRWVTISQIGTRIAYEDIKIDGYCIPANTPIIQAFGAVHFDGSIYPDPDGFDPDRFNPDKRKLLPMHSLVPFGFAGGRKCVGWQLFNSLAIVALATIVHKLQLSLPPNEQEVQKDRATWSRPERRVRVNVTVR